MVVSGAADSTTDADGNTVQATDEEQAAAKETAKATGIYMENGPAMMPHFLGQDA